MLSSDYEILILAWTETPTVDLSDLLLNLHSHAISLKILMGSYSFSCALVVTASSTGHFAWITYMVAEGSCPTNGWLLSPETTRKRLLIMRFLLMMDWECPTSKVSLLPGSISSPNVITHLWSWPPWNPLTSALIPLDENTYDGLCTCASFPTLAHNFPVDHDSSISIRWGIHTVWQKVLANSQQRGSTITCCQQWGSTIRQMAEKKGPVKHIDNF